PFVLAMVWAGWAAVLKLIVCELPALFEAACDAVCELAFEFAVGVIVLVVVLPTLPYEDEPETAVVDWLEFAVACGWFTVLEVLALLLDEPELAFEFASEVWAAAPPAVKIVIIAAQRIVRFILLSLRWHE